MSRKECFDFVLKGSWTTECFECLYRRVFSRYYIGYYPWWFQWWLCSSGDHRQRRCWTCRCARQRSSQGVRSLRKSLQASLIAKDPSNSFFSFRVSSLFLLSSYQLETRIQKSLSFNFYRKSREKQSNILCSLAVRQAHRAMTCRDEWGISLIWNMQLFLPFRSCLVIILGDAMPELSDEKSVVIDRLNYDLNDNGKVNREKNSPVSSGIRYSSTVWASLAQKILLQQSWSLVKRRRLAYPFCSETFSMRFFDRLTASSSAYTANHDEATLTEVGAVRSTKDSPCVAFSFPATFCKRTMLIAVL